MKRLVIQRQDIVSFNPRLVAPNDDIGARSFEFKVRLQSFVAEKLKAAGFIIKGGIIPRAKLTSYQDTNGDYVFEQESQPK